VPKLDVRARLDRYAERHPRLKWLLLLIERYSFLRGSQTASSITLDAFLAVFALVVLASAIVGFVGAASTDLPRRIVDQLGISGAPARIIEDAVRASERNRHVATAVGFAALLWVGTSLAYALATAYNTAWRVRSRGWWRERLRGVVWMAGIGLGLAATFSITAVIDNVPTWVAPIGVIGGIAINTLLWIWTSWLLPNRRVPVRALLPAALFGGVTFEVLKNVGGLYVPRLVHGSSELYGAIGAVLAMLVWLLIIGRLVVIVTIVEVMGWEDVHGTDEVTITVPRIPGGHPGVDEPLDLR
jgi:membrane protein